MKSKYEVNQDIAGQSEGYYVPGFRGIKKYYVRLSRIFVNLLTKEKFDELAKNLSAYKEEDLKLFFISEGTSLLRNAINASNVQALSFIVNKLPSEAVKAVFNRELHEFLEDFLCTQKRCEERGENTFEERQLMKEKFKLFLQISHEEVQKYMRDYIAKGGYYLTDSIIEYYNAALQSYNAAQRHDIIPPTP